MLHKFLVAQWENEVKNDWTQTIKEDFSNLNLKCDLKRIQGMSKLAFKKMLKIKIKEYALDKLNASKFKHTKMDDLVYTDLEMQDYLVSGELSTEQKRIIFHYRTRMALYSENYKQNEVAKPCQICRMHTDSQAHSVVCNETMKLVKTRGNYCEIFTNNISSATAKMLEEIVNIREKQAEPS